MLSTNQKAVTRVRHALKMRPVTVRAVRRLSPHVVRVTFAGESLRDFVSASFDDHVKLILPPAPGAALTLPVLGPSGPVIRDEGAAPIRRDYTPRAFDGEGALDIELALHGDGPAAAWAARAAVGDAAGIGGPKGSLVIPTDFDHHLLIGDETALPSIARRLEELPKEARVIAVIHVEDPEDKRELATDARAEIHWLVGEDDAGNALAVAVAALDRRVDDGFAWAAGESEAMAKVRRCLVEQHAYPRDRLRVSAYWKRGARGHHEHLE